MINKKIRLILVFFLLIAILKNAYGQDIEFKHISIDNGLSQNTVNSIIQDKKGLIWIGTLGGLNKFDGYDFVIYSHNERDSTSLSHNRINIVFEDKSGNLWVGTDNGLNLFNPLNETFFNYKNAKNDRYSVYSIQQDKTGKIWIGTDQGLMLLKNKQSKLVDVDLKIQQFKKRIQYVSVDQKGNLWLGLINGVRVYDPANRKVVETPAKLASLIKNFWIQSIKHAENGDIWVSSDANGLFRYIENEDRIISYTTANGLRSNSIRDITFVNSNTVWIATKLGLGILNIKTNDIKNYYYSPTINPANSLSHSSVRCILKDKSNNIWMGTYSGGIDLVYNFNKIFSYKGFRIGDTNTLSNKEVNSILCSDDNTIWIATDGGGINKWNRNTGEVKVYKYNSKNILFNHVKDIEQHDDKNKLWVGTTAGVLIFDKAAGTFVEFKKEQKDRVVEFAHDYCFLNTPSGLWLGTNYKGLLRIKDNEIAELIDHESGRLLSNNIASLAIDKNKNLWIGHLYSGLNYLDVKTGKTTNYVVDKRDLNSISNNAVSCLFFDSKKRFWIGTAGGGLNYFDEKTKKFYVINSQLGLANNVHSIEEDNNGDLWLGTNNGIYKLKIKSYIFPLKAEDIEITNYNVLDGLQSNQFTRGASYKNRFGELFFGGINGLNHFYPNKIPFNQERPSIILTGFDILSQQDESKQNFKLDVPIDYLNTITLDYDQTYFTIKYAALNYIYPERNTYAYRLEGLRNDNWQNVYNQRFATYTGLEPGTYIFKVKAANNSGVWSNLSRDLKIIVLPPWYKTKWAYFLYFLILMVLLYVFNYYSKYAERLKNKLEFESQTFKKEQELTQKKLSFFINISHEIKTPITMIMAPLEKLLRANEGNPKTLNYLNLMNKSGQRLLNLIDQLLDLRKLDGEDLPLKAAEGNLVRFVKEIGIVFSNLAQNKEIDIEFNSSKTQLLAWFDRDKLEKVLFNVISNAIKYTPSFGKINIDVDSKIYDGQEFAVISIVDNGCGIAPERIDKIFQPFQHLDSIHNNVSGTGIGLAFAKELMNLHHGFIEVKSTPAQHGKSGYTCFTIRIPTGKEYLTPKEIDLEYLSTEDVNNYKSYSLDQRSSFSDKKASLKEQNNQEKFVMLLVEDNEDVLNFLKESFEDEFEVIKAKDGFEGYQLAQEKVPDIIISDVMMPLMNGIELCENIKTNMLTSHIPIILLTARNPLIFKLEGLESGADEYITKPFNFELLEVKVWNLLDNRQKMRVRYQKEITLQPTNTSISTFDDKFIEKVMKYIEENIAEESLNVEDLSQHIGMSRGNLYKKLKALTSKSPVEFIRYVRLKRAAQLLKQYKVYVNEVSFMVGFQDVTYFRKCFKEEFGITPTEFSKKEGD